MRVSDRTGYADTYVKEKCKFWEKDRTLLFSGFSNDEKLKPGNLKLIPQFE